jgi:uncharacterized protein
MVMEAVIADTGFVVALLNQTDSHHSRIQAIYRQYPEILLPKTVLVEVAYLIGRDAGIPITIAFLRNLSKSRFQPIDLILPDLNRIADILEQYIDSRIDFVDASIMAIAERCNIETILTLDQRDFRLFRPKHCHAFTLLP